MKDKPLANAISTSPACDHEVIAMVGILVRLAGWETVLAAMQSVARGSGQTRVVGTILAAREWLYGRKQER